jgi:TRAP-type mannitol/chloroaromatic compound transport system permease small subunit
MAHALVTRGHVRIDALYGHLGRRTRIVLDLLALIVLGIFLAAVLERSWDVASTSYVEQIRSNSPLRIPLAWAQLPWFFGFALFGVALVLAVLRTLLALLRGDYATAAATSSAVTQDEEVESELEGLGIARARQGPGS